MMVSRRVLASRRSRLLGLIAACVGVGALLSALILPQYFSNAAATSVSTVFKTGTNTVNNSIAASSDAPGGAKTGTAKPGDTLKWVVSYQNNTSANASVNMKDVIANAGTYVPGSLQLPPNPNGEGALTPQYSTDAGATWASGTPPANANGLGFTGTVVPQGTQQVSVKFPAPSSTTVQTSGGDAYNVVVRGDLVYGVYHHRTGAVVYCAKWADGTTCPGWPTNANNQYWSSTVGTAIGTGTGYTGFTAWQGGTWISGNKLFWLQGTGTWPNIGPSGTGCLDLSLPTPVSCGFAPLAAANGADANGSIGAMIGSTALAASNGKMYATTVTTAGVWLVCVNPATGTGCGSTQLSSVTGAVDVRISEATFGDYVFTSIPTVSGIGSSIWKTYCYNTSASALCSGSWPVASAPLPTDGASTFAPVLSTSGAVTGVCAIGNAGGAGGDVCWNLAGVVQSNNPYTGTGAHFNVSGSTTAGDAFTVGSKVYLASGDTVICLDFGSYSGAAKVPACSGFTPVPNRWNYTVRTATDVAPNCLVANGDAGQIRLFNALTGGGCLAMSGPTRMTVDPTTYYCGDSGAFRGWDKLTLSGVEAASYANSTITLRDQNNNVITGFDKVTLPAGVTMDISGVPTSVTSIEAEVTINGIKDPASVVNGQMSLTWKGDPPQMCFQTVAPPVSCDAAAPLTLSNTATAVTTSTAGSDAPGGNTTGGAKFDVRADASQCSLAYAKTSPVQTAFPGDKVGYSIAVKNTGSLAYDKASLTDDLSDVLKDATYNNDHAASVGTAAFQSPTLAWSGGLAPGQTATITYSVTVKNPDPGDHSMKNTIVSPVGNCTAGSSDPACTWTVDVTVKDVLWHKVDSSAAANILAGAAWTFTPVDGTGKPTGPAIVVDDCVAAAAGLCMGADIDPVGGVFRLTNLGPGTYSLVETKAPTGFLLSKTPIPVTITAASTTVALPDVVNKQMPVPAIPFTGGLGTDLLTFTGGGLLATVLGLVTWQYLRRRKSA
ncbi:SpaA isopeptide-forming pilin-related protein [Leifsonia sp. NPDC014704]|uniref:DUF7927 domain-containing protein n=1 Tax=Leifsonia sp. NPDC014704 TaxID=3364123 RepID=UPI0036F48E54